MTIQDGHTMRILVRARTLHMVTHLRIAGVHHDEAVGIVSETTHSSYGHTTQIMPERSKKNHFSKFCWGEDRNLAATEVLWDSLLT